MILGRKGQKKRHPYVTLTLLGLAAAGVASIYNKGKHFFREKCECAKQMAKRV
jgi:hypothetical protein